MVGLKFEVLDIYTLASTLLLASFVHTIISFLTHDLYTKMLPYVWGGCIHHTTALQHTDMRERMKQAKDI